MDRANWVDPDMKGETSKGFTLIELMIVVGIIGVIAAFAMPTFKSYIDTANMTKVNAAYYSAIHIGQNEFSKDKTDVALGMPSDLPVGDDSVAAANFWIEIFNENDIEAPGGGPAYVNRDTSQAEANEKGAVRVLYNTSTSKLKVFRPQYLSLTPLKAYVSQDGVRIQEL